MAEKRGNLVKLIYDFDTAKVMEIQIKGNWYRVTAKRFRSFDGPRRLTGPTEQPGHGIEAFQNIKMITEEYVGPVYLYDSNNEVPFRNTGKYIEPAEKVHYPDPEQMDAMAEKRMKREEKLY